MFQQDFDGDLLMEDDDSLEGAGLPPLNEEDEIGGAAPSEDAEDGEDTEDEEDTGSGDE